MKHQFQKSSHETRFRVNRATPTASKWNEIHDNVALAAHQFHTDVYQQDTKGRERKVGHYERRS